MFITSPESLSQNALQLPVMAMALIMHLMSSLPVSLSHSATGPFWVHLPNKPFTLESLSWGLLLREPRFRQACSQDCDAGPQGVNICMILGYGLSAYLNQINYLSVVPAVVPP